MFETQTIDIMDYETLILERLTSELHEVLLGVSVMGMLGVCFKLLVGRYFRRKEEMRTTYSGFNFTKKAIRSEGEKTRTEILDALSKEVPEKQKSVYPSWVVAPPDMLDEFGLEKIEVDATLNWVARHERIREKVDRIKQIAIGNGNIQIGESGNSITVENVTDSIIAGRDVNIIEEDWRRRNA